MRSFKGVGGGILKSLYLALVQCSTLTKVALGGYWLHFLFALHTISSNYKIMLRASSKAWSNVASRLRGAQKTHLTRCTICYQTVHSLLVYWCHLPLSSLLFLSFSPPICSSW